MKLYLIKDKISGNIIFTRTAENLDVFKRYLIANRIDLVKENNHSSLRLLNDSVVYEVDIRIPGRGDCLDNGEIILESDSMSTHSDNGLILSVVLVIKDFFDQFDKKSGSLEDKV